MSSRMASKTTRNWASYFSPSLPACVPGLVCCEEFKKPNNGTHDSDIDLNRSVAVQDAG
jgi:hypothetical protein